MPNLRRKAYLNRYAKDTRPKWNDPDLLISDMSATEFWEYVNHWRNTMSEFDRFSKKTRDRLNEEGDN